MSKGDRLWNIVVNVKEVTRLFSLYGNHFEEYVLEPDWIYSTALESLLGLSPQQISAIADVQSQEEMQELQALLIMVEQAKECIEAALPQGLSLKHLCGLCYGGYQKENILLYLSSSYEYE